MTVISSCLLVGCANKEEGAKDKGQLYIEGIENGENVRLETTAISTETGLGCVEISAIILPEDAPNKQVDWKAYWIENNIGENANVLDYISLKVESDGSSTVTVAAKQDFYGSVIGVKATTRVGRFTAVCKVNFIGPPTDFEATWNGKAVRNNSSEILTFGATTSNYFYTTLSNEHGVTNFCYNELEIESIEGIGKFMAHVKDRVNGTTTEYDKEINVSDKVNLFTSASVEAGGFRVNAIRPIGAYYEESTGARSHIEYQYTSPCYENGNEVLCYFKITVREKVSGVRCSFYYNIGSSINSLSLTAVNVVL